MEPPVILRLLLLRLLKQAILRKRRQSQTNNEGSVDKSFCRRQAVCPTLAAGIIDPSRLVSQLFTRGNFTRFGDSVFLKAALQPLLKRATAVQVRRSEARRFPGNRNKESTSGRDSRGIQTNRRRSISSTRVQTQMLAVDRRRPLQLAILAQNVTSSFSSSSSSLPLSTSSSVLLSSTATEMPSAELPQKDGLAVDLTKAMEPDQAGKTLPPRALVAKGRPGFKGYCVSRAAVSENGDNTPLRSSTTERSTVKDDSSDSAPFYIISESEDENGDLRPRQGQLQPRQGQLQPHQHLPNPAGARLRLPQAAVPQPPPAHQQQHEHLWQLEVRHQQILQHDQLIQQPRNTTGTQTVHLEFPPLLYHPRNDDLPGCMVVCPGGNDNGSDEGDVTRGQFPISRQNIGGSDQQADHFRDLSGSSILGECSHHSLDLRQRPTPHKRPGSDPRGTGCESKWNKRFISHETAQPEDFVETATNVNESCQRALVHANVANNSCDRANEEREKEGGITATIVTKEEKEGEEKRSLENGDPAWLLVQEQQGGGSVFPPSTSDDIVRSGSRLVPAVPRYKRQSHIDAEHRRRDKISKGMVAIHSMVPSLWQNLVGHVKHSKAGMLSKTVDYIRSQQCDVRTREEELTALRQEVVGQQRELQQHLQQLREFEHPDPKPPRGVKDKEHHSHSAQEMLDGYIRSSVANSCKFWIFSFVVRVLHESYSKMVTRKTYQEFLQTVHDWSDDQLTLVHLRPVIVSVLRAVGTTTSIMTKPEKLQDEIRSLTFTHDIQPHTLRK